MTASEFGWLIKAHRRRDINEWRRVRWLAAVVVNVNRSRRQGTISPQRLLKLPEESDEPQNIMSRERIEYLKKLWSN